MSSSVSLEIFTVLNYTYKVNFEYRLNIRYRLISKNSGIEPVIYQSVSKNSGIKPVIYRSVLKNSYIEPALLLFHMVLLLGTVCYVKIRLNYNVSIEYRVSNKIHVSIGIEQNLVSNQHYTRSSMTSTSLQMTNTLLIPSLAASNGWNISLVLASSWFY